MLSPRPRALAPLPSAPCCLSAMSPAPSWPSPHPDAELVARIRGGDAAAFELLFRTYHSDLRAFAVFASSSRKMPGSRACAAVAAGAVTRVRTSGRRFLKGRA
jgi:hypothetical protein